MANLACPRGEHSNSPITIEVPRRYNEAMINEDDVRELQMVLFPHPALRRPAKPIRKVDRALKTIVARMFELMYAHRGIGLAANQVDLPLQLFILNLEGEPQRGEERVFINPVIEQPKGRSEAEEGCLSIPGVYGKVLRPEQVRIKAFDLSGNSVDEVVSGMLSRAVQHEFDHLQGTLFPDRMSEASRKAIGDELQAFIDDFNRQRQLGRVQSDEQIEQRLTHWEQQYC